MRNRLWLHAPQGSLCFHVIFKLVSRTQKCVYVTDTRTGSIGFLCCHANFNKELRLLVKFCHLDCWVAVFRSFACDSTNMQLQAFFHV